MTREQINIRLNDMTRRQLDELTARLRISKTDLFNVAIDRMYREERETMIKFHTDKDQLTAAVEQELYNKETGFTTYIEVVPGGTDNGLDYGPLTIDIVYLAGQQVVYRHGSDDYDSDWELGYIEDAAEAALGDYEQNGGGV